MALKTWKNMVKFPHLASLALLALLAVAIHLTRNKGNAAVRLENQVLLKEESGKNDSAPACNLFSGRWVYDNVSYPLYKERQCSFMEYDFACEISGRQDLKYQNWRWQPHLCDLPRFNGTALLEKIRGKKVVFVGDSLNRNQWRSMLCLIESYLPPSSKKSVKLTGNLYSFHSTEYNATIGFYWAPMLVESNCDDAVTHRVRPRIVRIKSIETHGRHWIDADILVFDSFTWWMDQTMTILWGSFESPDAIYKKVEMKLRRYEIALSTWSDWLEMHINRTKTKLFFTSLSPYPLGNTVWSTDDSCHNKTEPILDERYWASAANRSMMRIVESTIEKLSERGVKVEYLNITQLSGYREDAHPSIFRTFWGTLTNEEVKNNVDRYADCMHWCLPGVPDVWNQILYAYIMKS
ncbi:protein trichome birefringence-like 34 [Sesamum alatum]|uniref:Protein trichome birefringence-like 34 n=1 Tax=Sesamum alatum TaxID=300844 RepID=A0AAE2CE90_9LAMI|nr:protein trichome birefringence-like 34 [Sesamum alatum]